MSDSISPTMQGLQTMALLGSYVPRQCGIATFTNDLRTAIAAELGERQTMVIAMDDQPGGYEYPSEVSFQIPQHRQAEYVTAADMLNINQTDCLVMQHEYGIFGGRDGSFVLDLLRNLRMPLISTLHTVLAEPSSSQKTILKEIVRLSDRVVVMSQRASSMLEDIYAVSRQKIAYIPHGIPDVSFVDPHFFRDQFALEGRRVLLTFGLLSPGKGIEVAIRALAKVVEQHPDVVYIILGATHPHVLRNEGNSYLHSLQKLVSELGLQDNVQFHNRYVSLPELLRYIGLADIYVTPYPNRQQITSGTLAYALGAGKAIVSTPYWHAEELLANGRGRLFDFGDSDALATQVVDLLSNDAERHAIRKRAYMHGRPMVWAEVAKQYIRVGNEVLIERRRTPRPINLVSVRAESTENLGIPDVDLSHLKRLTDDVGLFQHAIYATPDRRHGYCTDDNARALLVGLMYYDQTRDTTVLPLVDRYMSFLHFAYDEQTRRFRNFMTYDRRWNDEKPYEDVDGRAMWALGTAAWLAPTDGCVQLAVRLVHEALSAIETFSSPRGWAFAVVGLSRFLQRFEGDTLVRRVRWTLASRLRDHFIANMDERWPWCEPVVTYANAKLPHALIITGHSANDDAMRDLGLKSLRWLVEQQTTARGRVSIIGNHGWMTRDGRRARFDQQPIDAMTLVDACADAYRVTRDEEWYDDARRFLNWFTGNNELNVPLYDYQTGGCRDGLLADGPNLNQGAESTLSWLISVLTMTDLANARLLAAKANELDSLESSRETKTAIGSPPASPVR